MLLIAVFDLLTAAAIVVGAGLLMAGAYLVALSFGQWLGVGRSNRTRRQ